MKVEKISKSPKKDLENFCIIFILHLCLLLITRHKDGQDIYRIDAH